MRPALPVVLRRAGRVVVASMAALPVASCGGAPATAAGTGRGARSGAALSEATISTPPGGAACTLRAPSATAATPGGSGVVRVPAEVYSRAFAAVVPVLCACTGADDALTVTLAIRPNEGELRAAAPDRADVDACLAASLAPGRFEPVAMDAGDCVDCGPRHVAAPARPKGLDRYGVRRPAAARAGAPAQPSVVVRVPVRVDRPRGVLADLSTTHEPTFADGRDVE